MLEIVHGGGSIVRNITGQEIRRTLELFLERDPKRVLELAELRAFMEAWAAREAARHRTEAELEAMRGYLEEMERDFERGQIRYDVDFKYHTEIAGATHNTIYLHLIDNIYSLINYSIKIHREEVFTGRGDQETILNHHRTIFNAIRDRNPDAAEAAMKEHLAFVVREFKRKFFPLTDPVPPALLRTRAAIREIYDGLVRPSARESEADLTRPAVGVAGPAVVGKIRRKLREGGSGKLREAEDPIPRHAAAPDPRRHHHLLRARPRHREELLRKPHLDGAARYVDRDRSRGLSGIQARRAGRRGGTPPARRISVADPVSASQCTGTGWCRRGPGTPRSGCRRGAPLPAPFASFRPLRGTPCSRTACRSTAPASPSGRARRTRPWRGARASPRGARAGPPSPGAGPIDRTTQTGEVDHLLRGPRNDVRERDSREPCGASRGSTAEGGRRRSPGRPREAARTRGFPEDRPRDPHRRQPGTHAGADGRRSDPPPTGPPSRPSSASPSRAEIS